MSNACKHCQSAKKKVFTRRREIHVRFRRFFLWLKVMIESSSMITDVWRRGVIQEKVTVLKLYLNMEFWRFKFNILGDTRKDVVMMVKDPSWIILCSNVCLRYIWVKEELRRSTFEVKSVAMKEDTNIELLHNVIHIPYAMLVSDNDTCCNKVEPWFYNP